MIDRMTSPPSERDQWMPAAVDQQRVTPLPILGDARGSLCVLEGSRDTNFPIARVYYIFGTQQGVARGFHAHWTLKQAAVCVHGSCSMMLDDGRSKRVIKMDRPDLLVEIGPMIWHEMSDFSDDSVLMVLADQPYREADYIRDYANFLKAVSA